MISVSTQYESTTNALNLHHESHSLQLRLQLMITDTK